MRGERDRNTRLSRRSLRVVTLVVTGAIVFPALPASAQSVQPSQQTASAPAASQPQPAPDTRWEIEFHGGLSMAGLLTMGSRTLPAAGPPLTTSSPIFPTRQVPSWLFGDGALLLNDANGEFGLADRVTPLDEAFRSPPFGSANAGAGVRIRRGMTPHVALELGVEFTAGRAPLPDDLVAAVDRTRATLDTAFRALLSTGPFTGVQLQTSRMLADGSSRDLAATVAAHVRFAPRGGFVPYATAGGGVLTGIGTLPSATIDASYQFSILGSVPIREADRVTVRYDRATALIGVAGLGVRREINNRWGLTIDARVFIGGPGRRMLVDASPAVTPGSPAGFIESFTHPTVQFSNSASTGRTSTLGGDGLRNFAVFTENLESRWLVTVGVFRRF